MRHVAVLTCVLVASCAPPAAVRAVRSAGDDAPAAAARDELGTTQDDATPLAPVDDGLAPVDDEDPAPVDDDPAPVDDSNTTCDESARPTPNAGIVEPAGLDGCPPGMARIDDVGTCMDRWEAHLVVLVDGSPSPFSPYFPVDVEDGVDAGETVVARSAPGAIPQAYVSGVMAADACANAGKRLCSDVEWTRACRGASDRVFPYGDEREPGVCNDARAAHPAVEYFGTSASWIWSELGNPCIGQQHDTVDATGANAGCVDESGRFFDLMGNLHEWIEDPAGTFRGGFYVDTAINGPGCLYRTTAHGTSHWDYSTGFRCCAD